MLRRFPQPFDAMKGHDTKPSAEAAPLAFEQDASRELTRLAWPIAVSMISYSTMTLVDTLFVGRLGASALAGVGLGGTTAFLLVCFSIGLLRAVKTLASQSIGAGRGSDGVAYLGAGLVWATLLGLLTTGVGLGVAELLPRLAATAASGEHARDYLRIRVLGAPLVLIYVAIRETRYAVGDTRSAMVTSLVANALNVVLDYVFIVELELGVSGAAWATVIGHVVEASALAMKQRADGFGLRSFGRRHLAAVGSIGLPTGLQLMLEVGAFALLAAMLAALSEREMAAHQIALQVLHFGFLPMLAVSEAASVLAGLAVGAGRFDLIRVVTRASMRIALGNGLVCTVVFSVFGETIAAAFTDDDGLRTTAARLLIIAAVFQLVDAANMVVRGVLRGAGDVRVPAWIGIVTAWVCTPPLTYLLAYMAGLGAIGGWLALLVEIFVGAAILAHRLASGGWHGAALASRASIVDAPEELRDATAA
jgi:MATE family multidrug resistance protein